MNVWMVRGGKSGEFEDLMLEKGIAVIGWLNVPDLRGARAKGDVISLVQGAYPDAPQGRVANFAAQLFSFAHRMEKGDLVVMPLKMRPQLAIGRITGDYEYRAELVISPHTRKVDWLQPDIPRARFGEDLLFSLGAIQTVCQIRRNNAEPRIASILKNGADPGFESRSAAAEELSAQEPETEAPTDLERLARDQIMHHIGETFRGHELARLVDHILRAEGFLTHLSPAGPDGGVDILAGRGALGLEPPRLCVQVKSSDTPADVTILRALQGTMTTFKAEQGLLVCWGGYKRGVEKEARVSHFSVRLWDADDLVDALLRNYERLSEELKSELPLKKLWSLVVEE